MSEIEDVNQPRTGPSGVPPSEAGVAGPPAPACHCRIRRDSRHRGDRGPGRGCRRVPSPRRSRCRARPTPALNTLRQAILDANANVGDDTIVFTGAAAAPGAVITLAGTQLNVTDNVDIQGPGVANLTISGNTTTRNLLPRRRPIS